MDGRITYQVIGYEDGGGIPRIGQTAVLRTSDVNLARFMTDQLLLWQFARIASADEELPGFSAEMRRGRRHGPLDTGLWVPDHQDTAADIAYLDAETGSVEWQLNAPTYVVVKQQQDSTVIDLDRRR
jgi:hypothetical protein